MTDVVVLSFARLLCNYNIMGASTKPKASQNKGKTWHISAFYSRFQVTFQSAFPKFVLNIPNYTLPNLELAKQNLHVGELSTEVPNYMQY